MILPTSILQIRITEGGRRKINLWLPVGLLWLIAMVIMAALSPIALLVCIVWPTGRRVVLAGPRVLAVCWAARGLSVRVSDGGDGVMIIIR